MLKILFQDDYYVAIHKPNGLLVHRTSIAEEQTEFALQLLRKQIKKRVYPIHRLDRPTSGVLLFTTQKSALKETMSLFQQKTIQKEYLAVVRGYTPPKETIDHPIKKDVTKLNAEPKPAVTHYITLAQIELPIPVGRYQTARYSLVKIKPETGRMHQIRRHFKHINHHILRDKTYGDWRHNKMILDQYGWHPMFLHASRLQFQHPFTEKEIIITAPLNDIWQSMLNTFNWSIPPIE